MDVKYINPFLDSFITIMPQVGFSDVQKKGINVRGKSVKSLGVMLILGIIGDIKGNVVYSMDIESAKKIASTMMMGAPVNELDDMAQSALCELSNMVTANASINLSNIGTNINISTPTLMYGADFEAKMNTEKVLVVSITADGIPIDINIAFE